MRYLSEPLGMVDSGGLFLFGFGLFFMLPYLFIFLVVLSLSKFLFDRYIKNIKIIYYSLLSYPFLFGYN